MKILGLDLGTKTLGIAISDYLNIVATGLETFRFDDCDFEKALERVIYYVNKEGIVEIALGLPLNMNGTESEHSMMSRKFKEMIEQALPKCKVALIDERLSTVEATNYLLQADLSRKKRKKVIDKMAAVVILDTYLMSRR